MGRQMAEKDNVCHDRLWSPAGGWTFLPRRMKPTPSPGEWQLCFPQSPLLCGSGLEFRQERKLPGEGQRGSSPQRAVMAAADSGQVPSVCTLLSSPQLLSTAQAHSCDCTGSG